MARGVALLPAGAAPLGVPADAVLVRDEFGATAAPNVTWALHTYAAVELDGARPGWARLTAQRPARVGGGNATVLVQADTTAGTGCPAAAFHVEAVVLAPPQVPSTGLSRLVLVVPAPAPEHVTGCRSVTVLIAPEGAGVTPAAFLHVAPLSQWPAAGPWV